MKNEIDNILESIDENYKEKYGFHNESKDHIDIGTGINEDVVKQISGIKNETKWMLDKRILAYKKFTEMPTPTWGANLSDIDYDSIHYYVSSIDEKKQDWDEVPEDIKTTFDRLGIPQAERKFLAGVATQYESEVVYKKIHDKWNKLGIIFEDTDTALKKYPELFEKYFGKAVPASDNKFAALNTAVWSGGSFIYVPKGVTVDIPLQAYFRINVKNMGQFERTLIIADEGSSVHYIEGCTAPIYTTDSLHSAVVEIFVEKNAKVRYTTIQNWSKNVYNLVTKRAIVREKGVMEWIDCNLGSKITMKYPSIYLTEKYAHGDVLSIAMATKDQTIDAGAKIIHTAPNTSSHINSKSICKNGGITSYRGLVKIHKGAKNSKCFVNCDAIIMDNKSQTNTYPTNIFDEKEISFGHEAKVSKVNNEQVEYLMSRGIDEAEASTLIVSGFLEPISKELPMEYALELNQLIQMSMEGSVG